MTGATSATKEQGSGLGHPLGEGLKVGDPDAPTRSGNVTSAGWSGSRMRSSRSCRTARPRRQGGRGGERVPQPLCQRCQGRFDRLGDRDDLWRLLVVITSRKASDQKNRSARAKRGAGACSRRTSWSMPPTQNGFALGRVPSDEPTRVRRDARRGIPERLEALGKDELRRIAVLRMEGYTTRKSPRSSAVHCGPWPAGSR